MAQEAANKTRSKTPPRVGYFLRCYPRFSQTFVVNEILELERQGLDIDILSQRRPADGIFHDSVCRVRAKTDYLPETIIGNVGKFRRALRSCCRKNPRGFRTALAAKLRTRGVSSLELCHAACLVRWAKKRGIKSIHVHFGTGEATVAWLSAMMGGPSYSLTLHAFDIFRETVDRALLARKINGSRFAVTVCESNRRFMIEHLPGVESDRIRVNYNGIDLERFSRNGELRQPRTIFAVGRLIEKKGFIYLVRAMGELRQRGMSAECHIAGDGPLEQTLRDEIKRLGLDSNVKLLGPLRQEQVRQRMQHATCLALPCVKAKDGNVDALPTVLLEAQACGCPVVSTRISGVPEIIEDRVSGRLAEPNDPAGLAECIADIIEHETVAAALAAGGRERAESRFDVRNNVRVMRDWLTETT